MSFTIIHSYCLVIALMPNKMYSFIKLLLMFIMLIIKCCLVFALITLNMYSFMIWMNISYMIIFNLFCVITWILVPPNLTKLWLNVSWNLWALKIYDLLLWMSFSKWIARNVHVLSGVYSTSGILLSQLKEYWCPRSSVFSSTSRGVKDGRQNWWVHWRQQSGLSHVEAIALHLIHVLSK